jgi:hypothetical protein
MINDRLNYKLNLAFRIFVYNYQRFVSICQKLHRVVDPYFLCEVVQSLRRQDNIANKLLEMVSEELRSFRFARESPILKVTSMFA